MPELVVQHIVTRWSKRTRGGEGRELRARLPSGYPLPDGVVFGATAYALHRVVRDESERWAARASTKLAAAFPLGEGPIRFRLVDDALELSIVGDHGALGAPARRPPRPECVRIGDRIDVVFNGRHQQFDEPWYEDHIVHVSYRAAIAVGAFLVPAARVVDLRVDLW